MSEQKILLKVMALMMRLTNEVLRLPHSDQEKLEQIYDELDGFHNELWWNIMDEEADAREVTSNEKENQ